MKVYILEAEAVLEAQDLLDAYRILADYFAVLAVGQKAELKLRQGDILVEELT